MKGTTPSKPEVILVGAGPGSADLVTLAGFDWLSTCECVIYDRLVDTALLEAAPETAERLYVGKTPHQPGWTQNDINALLISKAREGKLVVRLKGGDPFTFGRGGEETRALSDAGIPFRVIPGVTAASAAGAYAGIPLTERGLSSSVVLATGHEDPAKEKSTVDFTALAGVETVVFYMSVGKMASVVERLISAGKSADTPAAVVERAAMPGQRTVTGTLATLPQKAERAGINPPAVLIVGPTVKLREKIAWLEKLPLFGKTVMVTRPRHQAGDLRRLLAEHGARVILAPAVELLPPRNPADIDTALNRLGEFDWIVLTSVNGVQQVFTRLETVGMDARAFAGVRIAAIGSATAEALREHGLMADLVPQPYTTAAMARAMTEEHDMKGRRVLLARSAQAGEEPASSLTDAGAAVEEVPAYRTLPVEALPAEAVETLRDGGCDWITFTSASTVDGLWRAAASEGLAEALKTTKLAAIGPVTADAVRRRGPQPAVVAEEHTAEGLVRAIVAAESGR